MQEWIPGQLEPNPCRIWRNLRGPLGTALRTVPGAELYVDPSIVDVQFIIDTVVRFNFDPDMLERGRALQYPAVRHHRGTGRFMHLSGMHHGPLPEVRVPPSPPGSTQDTGDIADERDVEDNEDENNYVELLRDVTRSAQDIALEASFRPDAEDLNPDAIAIGSLDTDQIDQDRDGDGEDDVDDAGDNMAVSVPVNTDTAMMRAW